MRSVAVATLAFCLSTPAQAEMSKTARETAVQRACQAAIWAVPAVSTWSFAKGTIRDLGGKIGDVVSLTQPVPH